MRPKAIYIILVILTSILVLAGLAGFVLAHKRLNTQSVELSRVISETTLENERLEQLKKLSRDYKQFEPLHNKALNILPKEKKQAEVTAQIDTIVRKVGLQLTSISYEQTKGKPTENSQTLSAQVPGVLVMPVRFQIKGTYEQLLSLLVQLENQERYMQVSNLDINSSGEGLLFNVSLEVFLKP